MKSVKNKGFLATLNAVGRNVPVKTPVTFKISNRINGFEHVFYGTALIHNREAQAKRLKQSP